ncbi:MAG: methyltransferase domain-containing protein [Acidobacteria bacterium]|nr:methyltransferase domain-containing protein [Acidobacteriota bacterium]MCA1608718.1 methyltransferase domain-containing protein [Acidobacteriota bacterium]
MATPVEKLEPAKTQSFYDRIADVHNLALKINGYRSSVEKYLRSLHLDIGPESVVLDAGSGTGIVTLGFCDAGFRPRTLIDLDLSHNSLGIGRDQFEKEKNIDTSSISPTQGNVVQMPFADDTFDLVLTCGVLEYVSLDDGLREIARVMKQRARLVFIPVKPSVVGSVLELLYKFKIHPPQMVKRVAEQYFRIVGNHEFPIAEPIAWSKTIFLLEKR